MQNRYSLPLACTLLLLLFLLPESSSAQSWQWARRAGGPEGDTLGGLGLDAEGYSYVVGTYQDEVTFNATTFSNGQNRGFFIAKSTALGALQWAAQGNGSGEFLTAAIAVDAGGTCFVTGSFNGSVNFAGVTLTSEGGYDLFIAKYSSFGILQWAKRAGGSGDDIARGVAIDSSGNVLITGSFSSVATIGGTELLSSGSTDAFVAKYDPLGGVIWGARGGGPGADDAFGVASDGNGNAYITGMFTGAATFGSNTITSNGADVTDIFVAKFSAAGAAQWGTKAGGAGSDAGLAIAADRFGNSYVTGFFNGVATFDVTSMTSSGGRDIFLTKLDGTGVIRWSERSGGELDDEGRAIALDFVGNSYLTGFFTDSARFDGTRIIGAGGADVFTAKYDGSGGFGFVKSAGGTAAEMGNAIGVIGNGEFIVGGTFDSTSVFSGISLTSGGASDIFVARLGASSTILTSEIIGSPFCPGSSIVIGFSTTGVFADNNVFTAQLSDSTGSFASPRSIGTLNGTGGGVINTSAPSTISTGTRYRIRVVSSNPPIYGTDNGADLTFHAPVMPVIAPGPNVKVCQGEVITLDAGAGYTSYQWSTGAGSRTISVSAAGSYSVTVSNEAGCVGTSPVVNVTVVTAPEKPTITRIGNLLESSPADLYQWLRNGEPIQGENDRRFLPSEPGVYAVKVLNASGCSATSDPVNITSGVPETPLLGEATIYPHPNSGDFTLSVPLRHAGSVTVRVIDLLGREVLSWSEEAAEGEFSRRVDIRKEPAGLYILRLESREGEWIGQVLKR